GAIGSVDPGKPLALTIELIEGRRRAIEPIEVAHQALHSGMETVVEALPVEPDIVVPLALLAELAAHEQELLAGMRPHEGEIGPQIGKALPAVARHSADQRALAVDDLVMRDRQDEIFVESVEEAKGQIVVMVFAVDRI